MIPIETISSGQYFSYQRDDSVIVRSWYIDAILEWIPRSSVELRKVEVMQEHANLFVADGRIDTNRIFDILHGNPDDIMRPMLMVTDPDGVSFLIDGHHRYVIAAMMAYGFMPCYVIPEYKLRRFLISGVEHKRPSPNLIKLHKHPCRISSYAMPLSSSR